MKKTDYTNSINALTHKIIGCAMAVHKTLGNGFQEVIYQRALAIEFSYQNLEFEREKEMGLSYRGYDIGTRRVDFFVEQLVMVEIKAIEKLENVHKAQAINYCEAYNIADGLLINFGSQSLDFKRVYNKNLVSPDNQKNPVQDNNQGNPQINKKS
ncbi:GxxExxY protein [uncultured Algibacter sp.]|uniref:GxxExxY protein n=1 Tax=uncultured Algibacter sp. TaxID=298659 RepID=UPI0026275CD5|nr:GxxExxY protein [uncultured Algibacter sp.]